LRTVGTGVACYGKAVSENTAKLIGSNYILSNDIPGIKGSTDLSTVYVASTVINGATVADYYVFNFASGKGFVMVSGDDKIIPILAYSAESAFDMGNMSPATKDWIDGYKNQIAYVIENNLPVQEGTPARWTELLSVKKMTGAKTTSTFPSSTYFLCSTTWDQEPGYNNFCPSYTGYLAPTGCVATAMAQVMKFWNWPAIGNGSHTYTQTPNLYSYPSQTADFGNTAYNWTSMGTSLTASNPAIDTLMYHLGVSLEMQYTPTEAGTYVTESETPYPYISSAEYSFKTYFHYKRSLHGELRSGIPTDIYYAWHTPPQTAFTTTAWTSLIEAELNAGRPLLYKGVGTSGGHCWVCDGYNSTNMMHFNYGWSGASNGYYTVDAIAPPTLGTGGGGGNFNTDQGVVLGIQPDSFYNYSGNIKLQAHLDCATSSSIQYNTPFSIVTKISNSGTTAFNGSLLFQHQAQQGWRL